MQEAIDMAEVNDQEVAGSVAEWPAYTQGEDDERLDYFIERDGHRYAGTHLIIDLRGASRLDDLELMERALRESVEAAKATLLHIHLHHFTPNGGISGVAVLAESISAFTPGRGRRTLPPLMCSCAAKRSRPRRSRCWRRPSRRHRSMSKRSCGAR